ncbi:MAG: RNA pseudouridine synthase, partial [Ruminococcus sp.]|nr:RNA pseudouridine synthase [Ruminococcus sp.]
MRTLNFSIDAESSKIRIDKFLADNISNLTRSAITALIEKENVKVNNKVVSKNYKLKAGDSVEIIIPDPVEYEAKAENIPLDIVYEDNDLIVVNKPKGMVVHPAAGNYDGTLVNALLYH